MSDDIQSRFRKAAAYAQSEMKSLMIADCLYEAASRIDELEAELAQTRQERMEAIRERNAACDLADKRRLRAERELDSALAALKPFAQIEWLPHIDDDEWAEALLCIGPGGDGEFTVRDCRRARHILARMENEGKNDAARLQGPDITRF